jgi:hypothetical protein
MLTTKEKAEKRRIDRKVATGKASRKDVLRGVSILNKSRREAVAVSAWADAEMGVDQSYKD